MNRILSLVAAALAVMTAGAPAGAGPLTPGQRLRVDFQAREPASTPGVTLLRPVRRHGTLTALDATTLDLEFPEGRPPLRIPLADIDALALSNGISKRDGMIHGIFYGAAIGLALGAAVNAMSFNRLDPDRNEFGIAGVVIAGTLGGAIGGTIGSSQGVESWRSVPVRSLWASD